MVAINNIMTEYEKQLKQLSSLIHQLQHNVEMLTKRCTKLERANRNLEQDVDRLRNAINNIGRH